jgi:heptaprenyl diphosphate synthase
MTKVLDIAQALQINDHDQYIARVEKLMNAELQSENEMLGRPVMNLLQAGGKRLRPLLILACAQPQKAFLSKELIAAGASIEMLHVASLIHDDIIDNSDTRHGIESVHKVTGTDHALLSGDFAMAAAFELANMSGQKVEKYIAHAFRLMCEGQSSELQSRFDTQRSITDYLHTIHDKTATLLASACAIGGYCGHKNAANIELLYDYGETFGMAFQFLDDLSDILASDDKSDKPVQHDIDEGVYTYPILLAIQHKKIALAKSLSAIPLKINVKNLLDEKILEATKNEILRYQSVAIQKARQLDDEKLSESLVSFTEWFIQVSLQPLDR